MNSPSVNPLGFSDIFQQIFETLASNDWLTMVQIDGQINHQGSTWLRYQLFLNPRDSVNLGGIVARICQIVSNIPLKPDASHAPPLNQVIVKLISLCENDTGSLISQRCLAILRRVQAEVADRERAQTLSRLSTSAISDSNSRPTVTLENIEGILTAAMLEKRSDRIALCFSFLRERFLIHSEFEDAYGSPFLLRYLYSLDDHGIKMAVLCTRAACVISQDNYRDACLHFLREKKATHFLRGDGSFEIRVIDAEMQTHTARVHPEIICTLNSYFRGLMSSGLHESRVKSMTLVEEAPELLMAMLDFIHGGRVDLQTDNVYDLIRLSDQYLVPQLKCCCEKFLENEYESNSPCSNIVGLYEKMAVIDLYGSKNLMHHLLHKVIRTIIMEGKFSTGAYQDCPYFGLLLRYRSNLSSLDLARCFNDKHLKTKVEAKALMFISSHLPHLTAVNFSHCEKFNDATAESVLKRFTDLQKLNLSDCPHVGPNTIRCLVKYHKATLTELNLAGCNLIDYNCITLLAQGMERLTSLNLRRCPKVRDVVLTNLAESPLRLRSLAIGGFQCGIWDYGLRALAMNQTSLKELDISWCVDVTNFGLIEIASRLRELTSLNLTDCSKITDNGVVQAATRLKNLRILQLSMCTEITNVSLAAIEVHLPDLEVLSLARCSRLKEFGLISLLQHLRKLRSLNLTNCPAVSDKVVVALALNCPLLESLNVGFSSITNDSVLALLSSLRRLRHLDLQKCVQISDGALEVILREGIALESINLTGCPKVGKNMLYRLRECCDKVIA